MHLKLPALCFKFKVPKYRAARDKCMAEIEASSTPPGTHTVDTCAGPRQVLPFFFSFEAKQAVPNGMAIHHKISELHGHILSPNVI
jgi:hypothetical protein